MAKSTVKGTKIQAGSLRYYNPYNRICSSYVLCTRLCTSIFDHHRNIIYIGGSDPYRGAQLFPKQFTTKAYEMVHQGGAIWKSYGLTITMTLTGTLVGLGIISMTGYALQRKDFPFRNVISFYIYFTTLFSAGLAPYYLLMTQTYKLQDNYLASMASAFNVILADHFDEELCKVHSS